MTTSSDRLLSRWVPLAALVAGALAVALSFGPNPFGFHAWPKAPAPQALDRVVRVRPAAAPVAVARREPAPRPQGDDRSAPSPAVSGSRHPRTRRAEHPLRAPDHASRRRDDGEGRRSGPPPEPVEPTPAPEGGDAPEVEAPDGTPVAQVPHRLPAAAEAKPEVRPLAPPPASVEVTDDPPRYEQELEDGWERGHGHHGHGHH